MSEQNRYLTLAVAVIAVLLIILFSAHAHDPGRPELNGWFDHLASKKGPCCSFADGETVADVDWQSKDGHYEVKLDGDWIVVEDSAVITEPNRIGRTMVWPFTLYGETKIRCFMPGSMT
jgi:hypothetical protein